MAPHSRVDNKRQYVRLSSPYRVQAKELSFPPSKDYLIDSTCYDISKGGVCVFARTSLPIGTRLQVAVHIPLLNKYSSSFFKVYENDADQYFQAIGDIAWVRAKGGQFLMGINFVNTDQTLSSALGRLVDDVISQNNKKVKQL